MKVSAKPTSTSLNAERPQQAERDQRQAHERDRIGHEHDVVVGLERAVAPPVQEQQPDERHRDRDQRPGEFIGVVLQLVEQQRRIFLRLRDRPVEPAASRCRSRRREGRRSWSVPSGADEGTSTIGLGRAEEPPFLAEPGGAAASTAAVGCRRAASCPALALRGSAMRRSQRARASRCDVGGGLAIRLRRPLDP